MLAIRRVCTARRVGRVDPNKVAGLDGFDETMLARIRRARAVAWDRAWLARGELTGRELGT